MSSDDEKEMNKKKLLKDSDSDEEIKPNLLIDKKKVQPQKMIEKQEQISSDFNEKIKPPKKNEILNENSFFKAKSSNKKPQFKEIEDPLKNNDAFFENLSNNNNFKSPSTNIHFRGTYFKGEGRGGGYRPDFNRNNRENYNNKNSDFQRNNNNNFNSDTRVRYQNRENNIDFHFLEENNNLIKEIMKTFTNLKESSTILILKEIYLNKVLTIEEIINFLFREDEMSKNIRVNQGRVNYLNSEDFERLIKNEKPEHIEYIYSYNVQDNQKNFQSEEDNSKSKRRLICLDRTGEFYNYIPKKCESHWNNFELECNYSHNEYEINYHYLKYKTLYCKKQCNSIECPYSHSSHDLRRLAKHKKTDELIKLFYQNKYLKGKIRVYENELPDKFDLDTYKVYKCPMQLQEYCNNKDYHFCLFYHDEMERRRDPRLFHSIKNLVCDYVIDSKSFKSPSNCPKGDNCEYFHTKNELHYDLRNYSRQTYCKRNHGKKCILKEFCYGIHVDDTNERISDKQFQNMDEKKTDAEKNLTIEMKIANELREKIKSYQEKLRIIECPVETCRNKKNIVKMILSECPHICCEKCNIQSLKGDSKICGLCKKESKKSILLKFAEFNT